VLFPRLAFVLDPEPHEGSLNMAIDEVLLAGASEPLLRVYHWARPTVSLGYFGRAAEVAAAWPGRELVRRWTGGGTVPHGNDFTYTLIVPRSAPFFKLPAAESYCAVHQLVAALLASGETVPSVTAAAAPKVSTACFQTAVQHDVILAGRKVAGAAQRRTRSGLLHQGSIQQIQVPAQFQERLAQGLGAELHRRELLPEEVAQSRELAERRYATQEWTWRW
jgi:lipoate-protein ligase A